MKHLVIWESAGCDGECGTVMVSASDSECQAVLDGDREYGIVWDSNSKCETVPDSDGECEMVMDSDSKCVTVLDNTIQHGRYSMSTIKYNLW